MQIGGKGLGNWWCKYCSPYIKRRVIWAWPAGRRWKEQGECRTLCTSLFSQQLFLDCTVLCWNSAIGVLWIVFHLHERSNCHNDSSGFLQFCLLFCAKMKSWPHWPSCPSWSRSHCGGNVCMHSHCSCAILPSFQWGLHSASSLGIVQPAYTEHKLLWSDLVYNSIRFVLCFGNSLFNPEFVT